MKNLLRSIVPSLLCVLATAAYAGVPAMNVTVSDAGGKAAFKGVTDAKGSFATSKLQPGHYVVQVSSRGAVKGTMYTIVIGAGTKKVSASSIAAEKLSGGVALKLEVASAGQNITGQVAEQPSGAVNKNGKEMVWIPKQIGSNRPGHWAEKGSAEAMDAKTQSSMSTQDVQNRQNQGVGLIGQ